MLPKLINQYKGSLGLIVCVAFFSFWIFRSYFYLPHDFANSYFGSYFLIRGQFDVGIFDPFTFNKNIFEAGFRQVFVSYNPNPPSTSVLFVPFALIPLAESKLIFNIISSALFLVSIYRLSKYLDVDPGFFLLLIPLVFFLPIRNQILFGQTYFLLFFLLSEGCLAYKQQNYPASSLFWSIAIFLKIFPVLVVLLLIADRNWKALAWFGAVSLSMLLLFAGLQGREVWTYYLTQVLLRNLHGEITSAFAANYQSASVFFRYLFVENPDHNPSPLFNSRIVFQMAEIFFKGVILGLLFIFLQQHKKLLGFGVLILASLLLSSGSTYSNLLLLLILMPAFKNITMGKLVCLTILIFLAGNLPVTLFSTFPVLLKFPRFFLLTAIFLLIVLNEVQLRWQPIVFFMLFFSISVLRGIEENDSSRLLTTEARNNIIHDYGLKDGRVFYKYWNESGDNIFVTAVTGSSLEENELKIVDNQIFFKARQLTRSTDRKLKPMLLDQTVVIYLSDKDSGIGFYNLRKLNVQP